MTNEIAIKPVNIDDSIKLQKVSDGLHKSGLYPNLKSPQAAFAVTQYGYELGLGPMTSLQNINLIQGKPAANGQTMLSLAMSRGVTFKVEEETHETCTILFKRGNMEYRSTFTVEDAKRAGLTGKDNWKKWPSEMLYWRTVAKGVRRIAPDAVMGLYTPDELTSGDIIDVAPQEAPAPRETPEKPKTVMATTQQLNALAAVLGEFGFDARDQKLTAINSWLESRGESAITSSKGLTKDQASKAIEAFKADLESLGSEDETEVEDAEVHE